jgi:hypothetical protein
VPVVEGAAEVAVAEPALVFPAAVAVAVAAEVGVAAVLVLDPERSNRPSHHK